MKEMILMIVIYMAVLMTFHIFIVEDEFEVLIEQNDKIIELLIEEQNNGTR